MKESQARAPIEILTCDPVQQVRTVQAKKGPFHHRLDAMTHYIPGVAEFLNSYSAYVQNLPSSNGGSVFEKALKNAITEVEKLGLAPISVEAHVNGLPVFVRQLVSDATELLHLRVVDQNANVWDPLSGPLSKFTAKNTQVTVEFKTASQIRTKEELLKSVVLSHCLDFPRFRALSQVWQKLAA